MQLSFPNGDHADVLVGEGSVRLGATTDNDVILPGLCDRHARLTRDARGIVLEILDARARAHVNARPVREKALVRYGDTLCLDAVNITVSEPDSAVGEVSSTVARPHGVAHGVLRGMSGVWFGKSIVIGKDFAIASGADGMVRLGAHADGSPLARIDVDDGQLQLISNQATGSVVNGRLQSSVLLRSGDQLVFGRERFVVECCDSRVFAPMVEIVPEISDDVSLVDTTRSHAGSSGSAVSWLIAAAAVMGLILAIVLLRGT